jgi:hypothetical protein
MSIRRVTAALAILFCSRLAISQDFVQKPGRLEIPNWPVAPFWVSQQAIELDKSREAQALDPMATEAVPTPPLPFTGINPCRIADTRGNGFTGAYGPPALAGGAPRNFTLTGQCGISGAAQAVSLNITVTNTQGPGFILIYPQGGAQPGVSTLNYVAGQTLANAAVVPLGTAGGVTVIAGVSGTDLIIDTNGYYAPQTVVTTVNGASGAVTIPVLPPGTSGQTLRHDGTAWVANGALTSNGTDVSVAGALHLPTAVHVTAGASTFLHNTGALNTFVGTDSGNFGLTLTGGANTGVGNGALVSETGGSINTAIGYQSLNSNTLGAQNTAVGAHALAVSATAASNTAVGNQALANYTGGAGGNTALGNGAGFNLTSGGGNMYLGNEGVDGESGTVRLGSGSVHTRLFVAGVLNSTVTGAPVLISGTAQLGIAPSSARFKEEIRDMAGASDRLLELRPVTFRYKGHADDPTQFGLIAEEVEKVIPELVLHDPAGQPQTVLYNEMPAMLLNELQKQERRIEQQDEEISCLRKVESLEERRMEQEDKEIASLRKQLESLETRLSEVSTK